MLLVLRLGLVLVLAWLLVRRLRLAVLSLVSATGEVATIWAAVWTLDLGADIVIGGLTARKDRVREVGRCRRKDTLVGGSIISIIVIASASTYSTKIEVKLLLWVNVSIHGEWSDDGGGYCPGLCELEAKSTADGGQSVKGMRANALAF